MLIILRPDVSKDLGSGPALASLELLQTLVQCRLDLREFIVCLVIRFG
ncbi:MAG TPA: hypothetical protein VGL53_10955 [Bryobacteraceae bacterium]|jgi:hypothetical protein